MAQSSQCALKDATRRFCFAQSPERFYLPMPPPNITGQLHMGHAFFLTLQDIQIRARALLGQDCLWIPGTDHAGLATHDKIIQTMTEQGEDPSNRNLYFQRAWEWKDKTHETITTQMKRMFASCDWGRERFTLDEEYQKSTLFAFKNIFDQGLIYAENGQIYMRMDALAQDLLRDLRNGTIQISPEGSKNELIGMLENIEPWCLSRQIPWGLSIPLAEQDGTLTWDKDDTTHTFDTWFLSSIWPFAILGWPEKTEYFEKFYPGEWMETGDDILFFWCARMLMMGKLLTGHYPFTRIFCHGIIRDKHGRKMSKSLGNGIDPLEFCDQFGTDSLRWHLAKRTHAGRDMRFNPQSAQSDGHILNKFYQIHRFLLGCGFIPATGIPEAMDDITRQWQEDILQDRYAECTQKLHSSFMKYCNEWIEMHKDALKRGDKTILGEAWARLLHFQRLFHPFAPFLTTYLHDFCFENKPS